MGHAIATATAPTAASAATGHVLSTTEVAARAVLAGARATMTMTSLTTRFARNECLTVEDAVLRIEVMMGLLEAFTVVLRKFLEF